MSKLEFFKHIYNLISNPNPECLNLSLSDTHVKGVFSLVIDGNENGKLTRVFISKNKLKPFEVQLHTHRYPLRLTFIKGNIKHHLAIPDTGNSVDASSLSEFEYKSPLNGGCGLKYLKESRFTIKDYSVVRGSTILLTENDYHTISCSKGSIWIVEELGFKKDESRVLGIPFVTEGLYNCPKMFQINDMCQIVARELRGIINLYSSTENEPKFYNSAPSGIRTHDCNFNKIKYEDEVKTEKVLVSPNVVTATINNETRADLIYMTTSLLEEHKRVSWPARVVIKNVKFSEMDAIGCPSQIEGDLFFEVEKK